MFSYASDTSLPQIMSVSIGPAPGLPFVGWAHLSIRDSDGHSRQVKGSSAQTPLLASLNGDKVLIEAELVVSNPLSFIKITNEDSYYFTVSFILGSCHHGHRALDHILLQTIPVACTAFKDKDELMLECLIPFAKGPSNRAHMKVELSEHKLVTKVSKMSVQLPVSVLSEVYSYRDGLRKYKQLESASDEEQTKQTTPQG
jgi:hypothetical protein